MLHLESSTSPEVSDLKSRYDPGVGVDIVEISRIERAIGEYGDRFVNRVFTGREIDYCERFARKAERYADSLRRERGRPQSPRRAPRPSSRSPGKTSRSYHQPKARRSFNFTGAPPRSARGAQNHPLPRLALACAGSCRRIRRLEVFDTGFGASATDRRSRKNVTSSMTVGTKMQASAPGKKVEEKPTAKQPAPDQSRRATLDAGGERARGRVGFRLGHYQFLGDRSFQPAHRWVAACRPVGDGADDQFAPGARRIAG